MVITRMQLSLNSILYWTNTRFHGGKRGGSDSALVENLEESSFKNTSFSDSTHQRRRNQKHTTLFVPTLVIDQLQADSDTVGDINIGDYS